MNDYQPRYLAYCRAHGRSPDAMLAHDDEQWPGGVMTGFVLWINARWADWRVVAGYHGVASTEHHEAFDRWLDPRQDEIATSRLSQRVLDLQPSEAAP